MEVVSCQEGAMLKSVKMAADKKAKGGFEQANPAARVLYSVEGYHCAALHPCHLPRAYLLSCAGPPQVFHVQSGHS